MSRPDFNHIADKIPAENGIYTWRSKQVGDIKVRYDHGEWFLVSNGDRLPDFVVIKWR